MVHGDDFTALGTDDGLDWYTAELEKVSEIKVRGRLGEGTADTEIRILNRVIRITSQGVSYEADPRHHELLQRSLGLEGSTPVSNPGVKATAIEAHTLKGEEGEIAGPVMDQTGRLSTSSVENGIVNVVDDDSILVERSTSLDDILNDYSLDNYQSALRIRQLIVEQDLKSNFGTEKDYMIR